MTYSSTTMRALNPDRSDGHKAFTRRNDFDDGVLTCTTC